MATVEEKQTFQKKADDLMPSSGPKNRGTFLGLTQDSRYDELTWKQKQSALSHYAENNPGKYAGELIELERLKHFSFDGTNQARDFHRDLYVGRQGWLSKIREGVPVETAKEQLEVDVGIAQEKFKQATRRRERDILRAKEYDRVEDITKLSFGNVFADVLSALNPFDGFGVDDPDYGPAKKLQEEIYDEYINERGMTEEEFNQLRADSRLVRGAKGTPAAVDSNGYIRINDGTLVRDMDAVSEAVKTLPAGEQDKRAMLDTLERRRILVARQTFQNIAKSGGLTYDGDVDGPIDERSNPRLSPIIGASTYLENLNSAIAGLFVDNTSLEKRARSEMEVRGLEKMGFEAESNLGFSDEEVIGAVSELIDKRDDTIEQFGIGASKGMIADLINMAATPMELMGVPGAADITSQIKDQDRAFSSVDQLADLTSSQEYWNLAGRIIPQVLITRKVGQYGGQLAASRFLTPGSAAALASQSRVATLFATGYGGLQSATFNARDVIDNGGTHGEALAAGILGFGTTFAIANGFNAIGLGGVESFRSKAQASAQTAKLQLKARLAAASSQNAKVTMGGATRPGNIIRGVIGEGVEEFIDEFINGLYTQDFTGATDNQLAVNAFKAGLIGAKIGGVFGAMRPVTDPVTARSTNEEVEDAADAALNDLQDGEGSLTQREKDARRIVELREKMEAEELIEQPDGTFIKSGGLTAEENTELENLQKKVIDGENITDTPPTETTPTETTPTETATTPTDTGESAPSQPTSADKELLARSNAGVTYPTVEAKDAAVREITERNKKQIAEANKAIPEESSARPANLSAGQEVVIQGQRGKLVDDEGRLALQLTDGTIRELSDTELSATTVLPTQFRVLDNGKVTVGGRSNFRYNRSEFDENGNLESVVVRRPDGEEVTLFGDQALDVAVSARKQAGSNIEDRTREVSRPPKEGPVPTVKFGSAVYRGMDSVIDVAERVGDSIDNNGPRVTSPDLVNARNKVEERIRQVEQQNSESRRSNADEVIGKLRGLQDFLNTEIKLRKAEGKQKLYERVFDGRKAEDVPVDEKVETLENELENENTTLTESEEDAAVDEYADAAVENGNIEEDTTGGKIVDLGRVDPGPQNKKLPSWLVQEMEEMGFEPKSMVFVRADLDQDHIREAIMASPNRTDAEKAIIIGTGSHPRALSKLPAPGTLAAKRIDEARDWIKKWRAERGQETTEVRADEDAEPVAETTEPVAETTEPVAETTEPSSSSRFSASTRSNLARDVDTARADNDLLIETAKKGNHYGKSGIPKRFFTEEPTQDLVDDLEEWIGNKQEAEINYSEKANVDVEVEGQRAEEIQVAEELSDSYKMALNEEGEVTGDPDVTDDTSGRLYGGLFVLDPDFIIPTVKKIYQGSKTFGQFSVRMLKEFGNVVRNGLRSMWDSFSKKGDVAPDEVVDLSEDATEENTNSPVFDQEQSKMDDEIDEELDSSTPTPANNSNRIKKPPLLARSWTDKFANRLTGTQNTLLPGLGKGIQYLSLGITKQVLNDIAGTFFAKPVMGWLYGRETAVRRGKYIADQFNTRYKEEMSLDSDGQLAKVNAKNGGSLRPSDVIEDVEENGRKNYDVSDNFLRFVADWVSTRNRILADAAAEGIDLKFLKNDEGKYDYSKILNNFYFPRGQVSLVEGSAKGSSSRGGRPRSKVRSFSNPRLIPTEQDGVTSEKYRYDDPPTKRIEDWVTDIYGRIEDRRLATHPDIVSNTLKTETVKGPDDKFRNKDKLGESSITLAGKKYRFKDESARKLESIFEGQSINPDSFLKKLSDKFLLVRALKFTVDFSAAGVQLAWLWGHSPIRTSKAIGLSLASTFGNKTWMSNYNKKNADLISERVALGGLFSDSIADVNFLNDTQSTDSAMRRLLSRATSPFTHFHTLATEIGANELYASMRYQALKDPSNPDSEIDPVKAQKIVQFSDRAVGRESLSRNGLRASSRSLLSTVSAAPGMYGAFLNMMADVGSKDKFTRNLALKAHSRFVVGIAVGFIAKAMAAMMMDDEDERTTEVKFNDALSRLNPKSKKFMTVEVPIGGGRRSVVSEGGFFKTIVQLSARVMTDPANADEYIQKFLKSKKSPGVGTALEIITDEDYFGNEITTLESVTDALLPITVSTLAQDYKGPAIDVVAKTLNFLPGANFKGQSRTSLLREKPHLKQTLEQTIFSAIGLSAYTESSRGAWNRRIEFESGKKFDSSYSNLDAGQKAEVIKSMNEAEDFKPKIKTQTSYMDYKLKQLDSNLNDPTTRNKLTMMGAYSKVAAIPLHSSNVNGESVPILTKDHKKMYRGWVKGLENYFNDGGAEGKSEYEILDEADILWETQLRSNGY